MSLSAVHVPVVNIAGTSDALVPVKAPHHVGRLLPNAPDVRVETPPGGRLGVLAGRRALDTTWALIGDVLNADTTTPETP
jgi:polyhydroxyalkanoate synthase